MTNAPPHTRDLDRLDHEGVRALFDHMPDVQFWVKGRDCRYLHANRVFLDVYRLAKVEALIGKGDHDLSAAYLADQYLKDDRLVMTGKKVINRIELNSLADGTVGWFITTKMPLRNTKGRVSGTTGFTRNVSATEASIWPYQEMAGVVRYIRDHIRHPITVKELAKQASLTDRKFDFQYQS